jgi:hypothetical protein
MAEQQEIINPKYTQLFVPTVGGINMVKCNKSREVYKYIKVGRYYVIELPDTKTILNVVCKFSALNSADMTIQSAYVNAKRDSEFDDYTVSYQYDEYDSIHYTSFNYREKCNLYVSIDDLF